jgi:hypothetical protein
MFATQAPPSRHSVIAGLDPAIQSSGCKDVVGMTTTNPTKRHFREACRWLVSSVTRGSAEHPSPVIAGLRPGNPVHEW